MNITREDMQRWKGIYTSLKCDKCGRFVGVGGWYSTDFESGYVDELMCKACMPQYKNYSSEEIGKEGAMLTISNDELEKKRAWKGEDLPCPKCGRVLKVIIDGNSVTKPAAEVLLGAVSCEPCRGSFLVVIEGRVVHHG